MYKLITIFTTLITTSVNAFVSNDYLNVVLKNDRLKWNLFENFIEKYDKKYNTFEIMSNRFEIFKNNLEMIVEHNSGNNTFKMGLSGFTDMNFDEFKEHYTGSFNKKLKLKQCGDYKTNKDYNNLPFNVDWSDLYEVNNQMSCGSCYAFSAVEAIEGAYHIKYDDRIVLSKQQVVDCSKLNSGCNGGLYDWVFMYAMDNALCLDDDYTYTSGKTGKAGSCNSCNGVVNVESCYDVMEGNQQELKKAITEQPISVAIAVNNYFQHYSSGVITDINKCPPEDLNHAVLLTGYGETIDGIKYWKVMNSWDTTWGENGFFRILRSDNVNDNGVCGIATEPSFPLVV